MSEFGQRLGRRDTAFGNGEPFVLGLSGEPIEVHSVRDLVDRGVPYFRKPIVKSFGTVGWGAYVEGMRRMGLVDLVRVANLSAQEFALEPGIPQVPGQV